MSSENQQFEEREVEILCERENKNGLLINESGKKRQFQSIDQSESVDKSEMTATVMNDTVEKKLKIESPKKIKFNTECTITEIENISEKYERQEMIGEGGFGKVYKVLDRDTNLVRAMKVFKKNQILTQSDSELELLKKLDHPNIIRIFDFYQDEEDYYMITEYIEGGCLFDQIQKLSQDKIQFSEYYACQIMKQILMAVNYSHSCNIVHRDLKAENILIHFDQQRGKYDVKVIDWGLSALVENDQKLHIDCGTSYFKAPEVINKCYDEKCDLWSCGALMYELITGCPPFDGETDEEIEEKIVVGCFDIPESYFKGVSDLAIDLLKKLLTYIPKFRLSAKQALAHPWFKQINNDDLSKRSLMKGLKRMKQFKADKFMLKYIMTFFALHTMSTEENVELTNLFNQIDKDSDGKISHQEMAEALKHLYNTHLNEEGEEQNSSSQISDEEIKEIINHIDLNQNGQIEYTEFLVAAMRKYTIQNDEFLKKVFNIFDKNQDGQISLSEVKEKLESNLSEHQFEPEVWEQIVSEVDQDGDKEICFEEFQQIINTYFVKNDFSLSQY